MLLILTSESRFAVTCITTLPLDTCSILSTWSWVAQIHLRNTQILTSESRFAVTCITTLPLDTCSILSTWTGVAQIHLRITQICSLHTWQRQNLIINTCTGTIFIIAKAYVTIFIIAKAHVTTKVQSRCQLHGVLHIIGLYNKWMTPCSCKSEYSYFPLWHWEKRLVLVGEHWFAPHALPLELCWWVDHSKSTNQQGWTVVDPSSRLCGHSNGEPTMWALHWGAYQTFFTNREIWVLFSSFSYSIIDKWYW
jgi:hypothetical protein